jgi:hypothetical protein
LFVRNTTIAQQTGVPAKEARMAQLRRR